MIFYPLSLKGAYRIELEPKADLRGSFVRTLCIEELNRNEISFNVIQSSVSHNIKKGTLRGLHYQLDPYSEKKIVYCIKGRIYDVIVDLRSTSPTKGQWFAAELSAQHKNGFFIPEGFAHGFQTLCDDCEVLYLISAPYSPEAARGIHWNDPTLAIPWPLNETIIADRDQQFPLLNDEK